MFPVKLKCVALAVMAMGAGAACADDGTSMFKISGFGTVGVNHSSEKNADYVTSSLQPNGSGRSRDWDWANDSRLGAQIDAKLTDSLSASVQLLAEHRYNGTFGGDVQLANLKWQATSSTALRVGRMPLGLYMVSDYQKVGYSMPWVHGPLEVYQTSAFSNFDGADVTYKANFGEISVTLNGYTGYTEARNGDAHIVGGSLLGGVATVESGYHTFRVGYGQSEATITSPTIQGVMAIANQLYLSSTPGFLNNGQQYNLVHHKKTFSGLGYSYDPGNWFLMSELVALGGKNDIFGSHRAAYVTAGYRMSAFTPYATVSRQIRGSNLNTGNPVIDSVYAASSPNGGRGTVSVGVRWDFMKNTALKLQYDRTTLDSGSVGMFKKVSGTLDENFNVFTAAVDFVF